MYLVVVSQGLVPKEDDASDHVLELLKPYTVENGGPLEVERVHFTPGRGNVIIKYQGQLLHHVYDACACTGSSAIQYTISSPIITRVRNCECAYMSRHTESAA